MNLLGKLAEKLSGSRSNPASTDFHPMTVLRPWHQGYSFRIADAVTGVCVFGATGSGKTSGVAKHLALGYLANDFGGLVLCSKKEERRQWEAWAAEAGRTEDLIIIEKTGGWRFNFLNWEAQRPGEGAGLTINLVALLTVLAGAVAAGSGSTEEGGGDNKFWQDALHHLLINLVDLVLLAGLRVSLPLMRSIVVSAPQSMREATDPKWLEHSACAALIREADEQTAKAGEDLRADFEECRNYWLQEFPALAEKTRSIVVLSFSILVRPFLTRPLRRLFSSDTNVTPEDAFEGKIIIVDLPVQEFRLAGRMAAIVWKYCFQVAVQRRMAPSDKGRYLRPVFLWADEAQNFITANDAEYQAVARSAAGCTVYLTQNRESYRRVLGDDDAVDSLLGNLQAKFFCQNTGETNEWASKLLGERWLAITTGTSGKTLGTDGADAASVTSGTATSEQRRYYVEPAAFTTLRRGGPQNDFLVDALVYLGGTVFSSPETGGEPLPYTLLTFDQRK